MSPDQKAWFVTGAEFRGESRTEYAWNEWELQLLDAASADAEWREEIRRFWDDHFPFVMSVKSCYAYFAIQKGSLSVIRGIEPEFEEAAVVAKNVTEFMEKFAAAAPELGPFL